MKFDKKKFGDTLIGGLIKNNPTFVLVLGTCPTIAMTTTLFQAFAMGMATTFVLTFFIVRGILAQLKHMPDRTA